MAKGAEAKNYVVAKLQQAFGDDYIGEVDKKFYVWGVEGGEKMQIAISLTCPKNPVGTVDTTKLDFGNSKAGIDFENDDLFIPTVAPTTEVSDEEKENLAKLLEKLGL